MQVFEKSARIEQQNEKIQDLLERNRKCVSPPVQPPPLLQHTHHPDCSSPSLRRQVR